MKKMVWISFLTSLFFLAGCQDSTEPVQEETPLPPSETIALDTFVGMGATIEQWEKEYEADGNIQEEPFYNSYNDGQIEVGWEKVRNEEGIEELRADYIRYDFKGREIPRDMALQEVTKFIPGKELESSIEQTAEEMIDPTNETISEFYRIVNEHGDTFMGIVAFDYEEYEKSGTLKVTHVYLQ